MFRRSLVHSLGLALIACIAAYFVHIQPNEANQIAYQKLVDENAVLRSQKTFETSPISQSRLKVKKEIWFTKDEKPIYLCIQSEKSAFTLTQKKEKIAAEEHLENIDCFQRADSETTFLTAKTGILHFPSSRCTISELSIWDSQHSFSAPQSDFDLRAIANQEGASQTSMIQAIGDARFSFHLDPSHLQTWLKK